MTQLPLELENYFKELNEKTQNAFEIAKKAREKGYDPAKAPEVKIAKNMAERVVGLVSFLAPQIVGTGIDDRIVELEEEFSILDWRVAFTIALEVSQQKFCEFKDEREAMEVGIRIGFAYVTNGVVSSPLEGFVNLELIDRKDGTGKFFRLNYAGPVRNAGGTAAATSVLIADYVRKHMGYKQYDPQPDEIKRCYVEISNYHERVTNLQYFPSEEEMDFLVENMPIEVSGDPTEKYEVANYKNLPRIPTNRIRAGYCLIYSSCIPLKAPKLWKQLSKWGNDVGMEQWNFLEKFIKIQKNQQAKGAKAKDTSGPKITPNFTFIADLVGGRPVFGHPLKPGGMRLRFGRSRLSGLSGQSLHPATMIIANDFIATASQLKVERPGKAAAYTVCDQLEGPIVRLTSGEVLQVTSSEQARRLQEDVEKILYLGDVLINYGDFLDRAHMLVPPGYCEEWWVQEVKKAGAEIAEELWEDPITTDVPFEQAVDYAKNYSTPLHPKYTFFYKLVSVEKLKLLWEHIRKAPAKKQLIFHNLPQLKEILEVLGVFHKVVQEQYLVVFGDHAKALRFCFSREAPQEAKDSMEFMQAVSPVFLRDKAGLFIGSRLGRPEKAKMRKLTGSPHTLFPCGNEGGRLRSINESVNSAGFVTSTFEAFRCESCDEEVVLPRCPKCDSVTKLQEETPKTMKVEMRPYLDSCLRKMGSRVYPDLIKGVRGTVNQEHATEHLLKGILRARHEIYVNKDGTVRYDASEVPVTHFRPKEIGISVEQVKTLGYVKDIKGKSITSDDQVIEIFPQDVILPACDDSPDEKSDEVLLRTAKFIDELLVQLYGLKPYYNAKTVDDLIGCFIIALAPHTSAGTIGRIIGFSKTQGLFYHPYLHCATRRDCFTKETHMPICKDGVWSVEKLGELVEQINPTKVVDSHGTLEATPSGYSTLGYVDGNIQEVPVNSFTKHTPMPIISVNTHLGKEIRTTANHKHVVSRDGSDVIVRAEDLVVGDFVYIIKNEFDLKNISSIDLQLDEIVSIQEQDPEQSYCLNVLGNHVVANGILTKQCDGDEGCVFLMMDAFLNFSQRYLPSSRGGTMDAPIVLTTVLAPAEVDDMVLNVDVAWRYPLEFYEACLEYKMPWDVKIPIIDNFLNTPQQFFGMGFTHDTSDMNDGNHCSAYKTLPTMQDKLESQMNLASKLNAVDEKDVARLVIEKHFIRDLKGNLRKFSQQGFRCVACNAKFRRPPLRGICSECNGKIIFTISEGSVVKYLTPCESLVKAYDLDPYLAQSIELTRRRVEEVFGRDPEKQLGLGEWFG